MYELTPREKDIAHLMLNGLNPREIADELILAYSTVRSYLRDMYSKLHVHSYEEAVDKITVLGLLGDHEDPGQPNHNLPALLSPLIGRQAELDIVAARLTDQTTRLVTLLGPGGMGKTRLALEAAWLNRMVFAGGAYLISLHPLQNPHDMLNAIADALPVQIRDEDDLLAQLQDYLSARHLLLVLDNFEHLLAGVSIVTDLLAAAPQLWLLVTSREALNVRAEWLLALNGLPFPSQISAETALISPAVQLFAERVQRVRPDFDVATEAEAVLDICRQVEGLPLALEIAASWTKIASCASIAAQIHTRLDFLASRFRDIPARHQSMEAVFNHSWYLLTDHEQHVLPRLAVFRGGFTRDAALVTAGATWADLVSLVEKSLIRVEAPDRYGMHELLRQYAEKHLGDAHAQALAEHCAYFKMFMVDREADIKGHRQLPALDEIEADFENVRMAWLYAIDEQDVATLDAMLESLYWYCDLRWRLTHSQELLRRAWEALDAEKHPVIWARLRAHYTKTVMHFWGNPTRDREQFVSNLWHLIDPCWNIAQQYASARDMAFCELVRAKIQQDAVHTHVKAQRSGGYNPAITSLEHSRHLYAEMADDFHLGFVEWMAGWLYHICDRREESTAASERSYALTLKIGDIIGSGKALSFIVSLHKSLSGDFELAHQRLQETQQIAHQTGDRQMITMNGHLLCFTLWGLGRFREAEQLALDLLPLARDINEGLHVAKFLQFLSLCSCMREDYAQADDYAVTSREMVTDSTTWERSIVHLPQALIASGQAEYAALAQHMGVMFEDTNIEKSGAGELIQLLPLAVFWLVHIDQVEYAASIMGLLTHHTAESGVRWARNWSAYQRVRQHLETELAPDQFAAAYEHGKTLDLQIVVGSLIKLL